MAKKTTTAAAAQEAAAAKKTTTNNAAKSAAPAQLTETEIAQIIRERAPRSMSHLRTMESEITEKYGKSNWISIRARFQAEQKNGLDMAANGAILAARNYNDALADAWGRIRVNKDFRALAAYLSTTAEDLANTWESGPAFVAATYPRVIDGEPAALVNYIDAENRLIYTAVERRALSATTVPGVIVACIKNLRKAGHSYIRALSDKAIPAISQLKHTYKEIVSVHNAVADADGKMVKGSEITGKDAEIFRKSFDPVAVVLLSSFNAEK